MNVVQTWIVVGIPGLIIVGALFVGRSHVRALIGYAVLAGLAAVIAMAPGGGPSAVVIAGIAVVLVATGRGTSADAAAGEHHQQRRKYTTAAS